MTCEKQMAASTQKVAGGLLAQRMFLPGEDPQMFTDLQDQLRLTLRPMGAVELLLVEKIGIIIWKQRRLVAAESASIQLATSPGQHNVRGKANEALGKGGVVPSVDDFSPMTEEETSQREWCRAVIEEVKVLSEDADLKTLAQVAPNCHAQLLREAKDDEMKPELYLTSEHENLASWLGDLRRWCNKELDNYAKREKLQPFLQLVQIREVAHVGMQLLNTFQAALDTELYRAMDALRKQQEWRKKNGIDLEMVTSA